MTETSNASSEYLDTLLRYYEDEIRGEAYFFALAEYFEEHDKIVLLGKVERSAAEAVVHGETGLVISEPENVQMVADAIARLLDDDDLRASMATRSRERVLDEFSYDVLAQRLGETLGVFD